MTPSQASEQSDSSEVHTLLIRPFLDDADATLGAGRVDALLSGVGLERASLQDPNGWISMRSLEIVLDTLVGAASDPTMLDRCARLSVAPKYAGFLRPLFRAFSPHFAFKQIAAATSRFNKVGEVRVLEVRSAGVTLAYSRVDGAPPERSRLVCRGRAANFGAIPTMFNLPPARVEHTECMHDGAPRCVYRIEWRATRRRFAVWIGAAVGALVGAGIGLALGVATPVAIALAVSLLLAGAAFGRSRELARDLTERVEDLAAQQDALDRSARAHETRFAELTEAKTRVEEKVEERTRELRETSDQLEQTLAEVRELDRAKTDFFSNVSHELRTPLTLLLGPIEDLRADPVLPARAKETLGVMHRNATRLLTLINQLLDLAKVDAGAMRIERAPADPVELGRRVVDVFRAAAAARKVELRLGAGGASKPIRLDSSWVESALTNLVANALRFVGEGGHVTVGIEDRGADVVFTVEDDGRGMAEADLSRVFHRFAQVGEASGARVGTGLGLAIVREAARLHGGEASVESELGKGTSFTLTFPRELDVAPAPEVPAVARAGEGALPASAVRPDALERDDASEGTRSGPAPDAPLALVVEDNPELRAHIADVLAARYRVRTAPDGQRGLELAAEILPDVVVSDIAMPAMDGIELCRALRADERLRAIPLLLVTAYRDIARVVDGFEAGANDYVPKPFHARELLARVDVHVRLRRLLRELAHRERLATLGTVAASVAHQVRNPLTSLISGLPAVTSRLGAAVDAPTRKMFDVMLDSAMRIERMTLDLLDLSRVDREGVETFLPSEGLEASARLVGAALPVGVRLEVHVDPLARVRGRAGELNHVFLNLLDNAARAVGTSGRIRVRGGLENGSFVVDVDDSGPGVSEADRDRIFEPFYTTRSAGQGTGLGLSIAKQVVVDHGGEIAVGRSDLGGASFRVRVPAAPAGGGTVIQSTLNGGAST